MTAHTPGPWRANGAELIGDSTIIATIHWHTGRDVQNAADAALIAAAPDLLAAVRELKAENVRLRAALGLAASPFILKMPKEKDINWERVIVIQRLEEAGATLLARPATSEMPSVVRAALESCEWQSATAPGRPAPDMIARMREAVAWLSLIPPDRYVLRRVVGARILIHPITGRHLFPWPRLSIALGADCQAVQQWYAQGIDIIVSAIGRGAP